MIDDISFNGFNILDSRETLSCKLGPNLQGRYITVDISLLDYEIMCKQTVDTEFCDCDGTEEIKIVSQDATIDTLKEFYITKTITKEVRVESDAMDLEYESNQLSFAAGFTVASMMFAIITLIICLF